jgi:hypothetical protein
MPSSFGGYPSVASAASPDNLNSTILGMYAGLPDVLSLSKTLIPLAEGSVPGDSDSWAEDESDFSRGGRDVSIAKHR